MHHGAFIVPVVIGAAGNFLCPAASLSSNGFKNGVLYNLYTQALSVYFERATCFHCKLVSDVLQGSLVLLYIAVIDIDTVGTFNAIKAAYELYFKVYRIYVLLQSFVCGI